MYQQPEDHRKPPQVMLSLGDRLPILMDVKRLSVIYIILKSHLRLNLLTIMLTYHIPINLGDADYDIIQFCNLLAINLGVRTPVNVDYRTLEVISFVGSILNKVGFNPPLTHDRFANIYLSQTYSLKLINEITPQLPFDFESAIIKKVVCFITTWQK